MRLNVLVVDDQRENLLAVEAILDNLGHNLILVDSGEEALRQILRHDVALVLLDVRMPGMDGFETARFIRNRKDSRATPIIFLTAMSSNEEMVFEGYSAGAVDYIVKPVVPEILRAKVKVFLYLAAARQKLEIEVARRRNAERVLKSYAEKLHLALDGASLGTWHWDLRTNKVTWSEKCRVLYCIPDDEEMTRAAHRKRVHPDDLPTVERAVREAIEKGRDLKLHYRIVAADGTIHWISSRARPYYDEAGRPLRMEGVVADITEPIEAEAKISRLNETLADRADELQTSNEELEAFVFSASHDLRGPLRHLNGFVELLDDAIREERPDECREFIGKISSAVARMSQLLDDLLAFSRLGRAEIRSESVDLDGLLDEVIQGLESDTEGREVVWNRSPLPEVLGDAPMLRQVFVNLISNAIKYTRKRQRAVIGIGCERTESEIIVHIRDNGAGFDMQYVSKLFRVFQRLHRHDEYEGTGVGLANIRRIVERHGGRTWAEGKTGAGATFYFSLPLERIVASAEAVT